MNRKVLAILVLFALLMLAANSNDTLSQRVRHLEKLVERLEGRVDQLTDEFKRMRSTTTGATIPQKATGVVFMIQSIRRQPIDDRLRSEGKLLVEEANQKEELADQKDAERSGTPNTDYYRPTRERLRKEAHNLRKQARPLRARGNRMIREAEMPHYEINGWDGSRVIVVSITQFDATSVLRRLTEGDFAQYTGDIISDSRNEVTIDARSIKPAQRPANFKDP